MFWGGVGVLELICCCVRVKSLPETQNFATRVQVYSSGFLVALPVSSVSKGRPEFLTKE